MSIASDISDYMSDAAAYVAAKDYSSALDQAMAAQALMAAVPRSKHGSNELEYSYQSIDNFIRTVRKQISSSTGMTLTPITYTESNP